ncbi:MAG: DUF3152 domain-containing protein [Jatrophihabitans sp.]
MPTTVGEGGVQMGNHRLTGRSGRRTGRQLLAALLALCALAGLGTAVLAGRPAQAAARIVYTYQVRGLDNRSSLASFATEAAQTYADNRGWNLGGSIAFRQVSSGGEFTLWLAAAGRVPGFGTICDSSYSCTVGRNVIINESRWLSASPSWNAAHRSLHDYRTMVVNHETGHWLGFGHSFCGGPGQPAPVMQQQSISLQGCQPNPWPLPAERQRLASSRGVAILTGYPIGSLDSAVPVLAGIRITGWMIDPDSAAAGRAAIWVDRGGLSVTASLARPDVARAHPGYGAGHGFALTFATPPGRHTVCAYGLNLAGPGATSSLGCRTVTVTGSPTGHLDSVAVQGHHVIGTGWVIDPDTMAPGRAALYVDGGQVSMTASLPRPDVAAGYPHFGAGHGFQIDVATSPGQHRACAYGINVAGSGGITNLGCVSVTVPN